MLIELIYFILISFGITKVLVWGSILNKIRPDIPPFNCAMCMGWWIGLGLFIISPYTLLFSFQYNIINAIMMAFFFFSKLQRIN